MCKSRFLIVLLLFIGVSGFSQEPLDMTEWGAREWNSWSWDRRSDFCRGVIAGTWIASSRLMIETHRDNDLTISDIPAAGLMEYIFWAYSQDRWRDYSLLDIILLRNEIIEASVGSPHKEQNNGDGNKNENSL